MKKSFLVSTFLVLLVGCTPDSKQSIPANHLEHLSDTNPSWIKRGLFLYRRDKARD